MEGKFIIERTKNSKINEFGNLTNIYTRRKYNEYFKRISKNSK